MCYYRTFFRRLSVWNIPRPICCLWARNTSNASASRHPRHHGLVVIPHGSASLAASLWSQNWRRLPDSRQLWRWNGKRALGIFSFTLALPRKASHLFIWPYIFTKNTSFKFLRLLLKKVHFGHNMWQIYLNKKRPYTDAFLAVNSDFVSKIFLI